MCTKVYSSSWYVGKIMYLHIRWSSLQEITLLYRCSFSLNLMTLLGEKRVALRYIIVYFKTHINWLVMINEA